MTIPMFSLPVRSVCFSIQVINNACATQAIISILLNQPTLEIGPVLDEFKSFAKELPPSVCLLPYFADEGLGSD